MEPFRRPVLSAMTLLSAATLLMLLAGCQEAEPPVHRSPALFTTTFAPDAALDRSETTQAIVHYMRETTQIASSSANDEEANLAMQRLIAEAPPAQRSIATQTAAAQMIHTFYLAPEALTNTERQALGEHVTVLLDHGSPDGALIARALDRIGDAWTAEQRHEAAARTIGAIEAQHAAQEAYHAERESEMTDPLERVEQSVRPDAAAQLQSQRTARAEAPEALRRHLIVGAVQE